MAAGPATHPSCAMLHASDSTPDPITAVITCAAAVHMLPAAKKRSAPPVTLGSKRSIDAKIENADTKKRGSLTAAHDAAGGMLPGVRDEGRGGPVVPALAERHGSPGGRRVEGRRGRGSPPGTKSSAVADQSARGGANER